jgi:hypothetical protein
VVETIQRPLLVSGLYIVIRELFSVRSDLRCYKQLSDGYGAASVETI